MARYELWVEVPDRPGNLAALAGDLATCGANIVHLDVHAGVGGTVIDRLVVQLPDGHADRLVAVADRYRATLRRLDDAGERGAAGHRGVAGDRRDVDPRSHVGVRRAVGGAAATAAPPGNRGRAAAAEDTAARPGDPGRAAAAEDTAARPGDPGRAAAAGHTADATDGGDTADGAGAADAQDAGCADGREGGTEAWPPPPLPSPPSMRHGGRSADRGVGRRPPTTLERLVALADGGLVRLRHLSAGDRDALVAHHLRCSADTRRHSRFLAPGALPAPIVVGEASPDGCRDHVALAALIGGEIVGAARYDREGTGPIARVAVIVEDRHQRRGIGSLLVSELAVLAANADLGCLRALAPGGDEALRGTLRRAGLGFTARRVGNDTVLDCGLPHGLSATA